MKTKLEKVMELTPIEYGIDEERNSAIAKKWTHKGLDFLLEMYHKYYEDVAHFCIFSLLWKGSEKKAKLDKVEECLERMVIRDAD